MRKKILSWGTLMCDMIAPDLRKVAEPGIIEYVPKGIELRVGGHPVDLVIDLAQMGVKPSEIGFVSAVGKDVFGDFLLKEVNRYRFQTFIQRVSAGTGKTAILSVRGEDRRCHLDPGACQHMSLGYLERVLRQTRPAFFTFRPGYTNLDTKLPSLLKRLRNSFLRGAFLLLDICAPYKKDWDFYLRLLPYVDGVHGNSKEITHVAGNTDFLKAVEKILSYGVEVLFLTKEEEGAEIITGRYRVSQPAFRIRFVEPSGCGDAFCAGVIYFLIRAKKRIDAMNMDEISSLLLYGQVLGASAATEVGCVAGVTRTNVQKLLKNQKNRLLKRTKVTKL